MRLDRKFITDIVIPEGGKTSSGWIKHQVPLYYVMFSHTAMIYIKFVKILPLSSQIDQSIASDPD